MTPQSCMSRRKRSERVRGRRETVSQQNLLSKQKTTSQNGNLPELMKRETDFFTTEISMNVSHRIPSIRLGHPTSPIHITNPLQSQMRTAPSKTLITAVAGMEYEYGKYYSEGDSIYLCTRQGEADGGKITLHHLPSALVGQYFEEVEK